MAGPIANLYAKVAADLTGFEKELTSGMTKAAVPAGDAAGKTLGERMKAQFSKQALGKGLVQGLGLGAGLIGVQVLAKGIGAVTDAISGSIDAAKQFDDQLRTINTVAQVSDEQLGRIGDSIQALSRETGKATDDLTAGFYDLVSAGVPADKAMAALKASAILATGALGTTGEAVDLVTSALGAYGKDASEATRVTDIFAQAVADGKTTVADLAGGFSVIGPIAAAAGIELEEVAAGTAKMTLSGDTASQAMTKMKSAISALLTPNIALNAVQKETGINFAELAKEKGLAVALEAIRVAVDGDQQAFAKILGSSEALSFGLSVTGENAGAMADELGRVETAATEGGVALRQYNEKAKSTEERQKRVDAQIKTLAQDIGELLTPAYEGLLGVTSGAVEAIKTLGEAFHQFERFISPHRAATEDLNSELAKLEETYGLLPGALQEYSRLQRLAGLDSEAAVGQMDALVKQLQFAITGLDDAAKNQLIADFTRDVKALGIESGSMSNALTQARILLEGMGEGAVASGQLLELLRQELGLVGPSAAEAATITQEALQTLRSFLQTDLVNSMQGFWTAGGTAVEKMAEGVKAANPRLSAAWHDSMAASVATVKGAMMEMVEAVRVAPIDMKNMVKNGKEGFLEQVRNMAWQAKHPFAEENYVDWLQRQVRRATDRMGQALKDGRPGIVAQEKGLIDALKEEMWKLPGYAAEASRKAVAALAPAAASVNRFFDIFGTGNTFNLPGLAAGGPTRAGQTYMVGERGPELWQENRPGFMTSTQSMAMAPSGGGRTTIEVIVRDVDGGMARAGMTEEGVARIVTDIITNSEATADTGYIR